MKKLLCLLLALLCLLFCFTACNKAEKSSGDYIIESENYKLGAAEFQFFLQITYSNFVSQYGSLGEQIVAQMFDLSKPLRDQQTPFGDGRSWFDYFAEGTYDQMQMYVALGEYAKANGITLSAEEEAEIEAELADVSKRAKEAGYANEDDYIKNAYGSLMNKQTLINCFDLNYLYNKAYTELYNSYTFTEEEYEAYAEKNKKEIYMADFMCLQIGDKFTEQPTEAQIKASLDKAEPTAITINNRITDKESFIAQAEEYFKSVYTVGEETDSEKGIYTEEDIKSMAKNCEYTGVSYNVDSANGQWVYDSKRVAGEHYLVRNETNGCYEIYFLLKPIYREERDTVSVRHILIDSDSAGDLAKAKAKAESILAEWKAGDATENSFGVLAVKNTTDTSSASSGGLYANLLPGQTVTAFNDWCFDPARKPGDTDIVKTEYGYHVIYFVSHDLPGWQVTADTALRSEKYSELYEQVKADYPVTLREELIDTVPDLGGQA